MNTRDFLERTWTSAAVGTEGLALVVVVIADAVVPVEMVIDAQLEALPCRSCLDEEVVAHLQEDVAWSACGTTAGCIRRSHPGYYKVSRFARGEDGKKSRRIGHDGALTRLHTVKAQADGVE